MEENLLPIQVRWSDLDPNIHVRHSVYYDWCALARLELLAKANLTMEVMKELGTGPILFREEAVFRREIRMEDRIGILTELLASRADYSRWTVRHRILKDDGKLCATVTVDGAWFDLSQRKLMVPPPLVQEAFSGFGKAEDFAWITT